MFFLKKTFPSWGIVKSCEAYNVKQDCKPCMLTFLYLLNQWDIMLPRFFDPGKKAIHWVGLRLSVILLFCLLPQQCVSISR